jgi:hypothetical protein
MYADTSQVRLSDCEANLIDNTATAKKCANAFECYAKYVEIAAKQIANA